MSNWQTAMQQLADRLERENRDLLISLEQERKAVLTMRPYLLPVLRRRQDDCCWFCEEPLSPLDREVDIHHVVPLHIAFPDGHGRPSNAADLRVVHRTCHKRKPASVR